jgi:release factor glutamine methyltransferase
MREVIKRISKEFGISRDEAELIVASLLEQPRFHMYLNSTLDAATQKTLERKLTQLKEDMPLEYVTQRAHFRDYELYIEPGVFIPRLETEYFIDLIAQYLGKTPRTILEIGTGTGAIAIALAHTFPTARIVATDISETALRCARTNVRNHGLETHIALTYSDLFQALSGQFDMIVSNPPYIPHSRIPALPKSVRHFEPLLALDGGTHGIQFIARLIEQGGDFLTPNGTMAIEIDEEQVDMLRDLVRTTLSMPFSFHKDLFNRSRYLFIGTIKE